MHPKLAACALVVLLAGCQARNPYAAFGPATIPAPGSQTPAPYYAATATTPPPSSAGISSGGTVISPLTDAADAGVSAAREPAGANAPQEPASGFVADASDSQPIRIAENPSAIRTATAPGTAGPNSNTGPQADPRSAPPALAPRTLDRLRGFIPALPAGGHPATHLDPRVVPAAYQQPGTFAEPPAAAGQWKAR